MEADFSPETKQIVERALEGEFPKKQSQDSTSSNDVVAPAKKSMSGFVEEPKLF